MRMITIILLVLFFQSCERKSQTTEQTLVNIEDTTFLKTIKWDSLNQYVDYFILKDSKDTIDTNYYFTIKNIAVYHYMNKSLDLVINDSVNNISKSHLTELILNNNFKNKKGIEFLLKINSIIGFKYRPDLLQTIFIRLKKMKDEKRMINLLKGKPFVQKISTQQTELNILNELSNDTITSKIIEIELVSKYQNLEKIKQICLELKQYKEIEDAFFTDFFTGLNENDLIFLIKTKNANNK